MRSLVLIFALLLSGGASADETPRFRLLGAETTERLERRLQSAVGDGYRIVRASLTAGVDGKDRYVLLLERVDATYDYEVLTFTGDLQDEEQRAQLAQLGEDGYRLAPWNVLTRHVQDFWLPDSAYDDQVTLILERPPDTAPQLYDALSFRGYPELYQDLEQRGGEGYEILGLWNSARRLRVVLQKPIDEGPVTASPGADDFELLLGAHKQGMKNRLKRAARDGYRILSAVDQSINAPPIMLLVRDDEAVPVKKYRMSRRLDPRLRKGKLERKLNKRGKNGYRVVHESVTATSMTLMRPQGPKERREYLVLSSRASLPDALEDATDRGFEIVTMFARPDQTSVLLERTPPDKLGHSGLVASSYVRTDD